MSYSDNISWEEVEEAATKMFSIWIDGRELDWAREAWGHLCAGRLANRETFLEETAAKLRLVTLARVYHEFCGLAWDEDPQSPINYLTEGLEIDEVALGVLAGSTQCDQLKKSFDDYELHEAALAAVTDSQRYEIFECLKAAYGGDIPLYTRLWHTRSLVADEDREGEEFEVTDANSNALEYVRNGFRR